MTLASEADRFPQVFAATDEFLRRIPPDSVNPDGSIMSKAFSNTTNTDGMSVNWANLSSVEEMLKGYESYGVVSITAELCWKLNQKIKQSPTPENPAHCDVIGRKSQSTRRQFARVAKWLQLPSQAADSSL